MTFSSLLVKKRLVHGNFTFRTNYNSNNLLVWSKYPFIIKTNCLQKYSVFHYMIKRGKTV